MIWSLQIGWIIAEGVFMEIGNSNFFKMDSFIIEEIINRAIKCMQVDVIYLINESEVCFEKIDPDVKIEKVESVYDCNEDGIVYIHIHESMQFEAIYPFIVQYRKEKDFIVYLDENVKIDERKEIRITEAFDLTNVSSIQGKVFLLGKTFEYDRTIITPENFKVLAIIHCYNEADIIEKTISYLLSQKVDVYLLDNWSEDGTYEICQRYYKDFPESIYLEHFPSEGKTEQFEWYNQLEYTEKLSRRLNYDWYIHYDVDEIRISPWKGTNLRDTLYQIDQKGFNLVENGVINYKITDDNEKNIFMQDAYFEIPKQLSYYQQTKTWKKTSEIDLKTSGGHLAVVNNPKLFPLKILDRHYPLRNIAQAEKKINKYRIPRFQKENKERGWHGHYQKIKDRKELLYSKDELIKWNDSTFFDYYIPLFMGCGIKREKEREFDIEQFKGKNVVLYGCGVYGNELYKSYSTELNVVMWTDSNYFNKSECLGRKIDNPERIKNVVFDYVIIAVKNEEHHRVIRHKLELYGVDADKIIWLEECLI